MSAQQVNSRSSKRGVEQIDVTLCGRFIVWFHFRNELTSAWWCGGAWPLTAKRHVFTLNIKLSERRVEIGKYLRWEKRCRFGIQSMQRKTTPQLPAPRPYHQVLKSITTRWKWLVMKSIFWHTITWLYFCSLIGISHITATFHWKTLHFPPPPPFCDTQRSRNSWHILTLTRCRRCHVLVSRYICFLD